MSEKDIERKFVLTVRNAGGIAPKFVSPGFDDMSSTEKASGSSMVQRL